MFRYACDSNNCSEKDLRHSAYLLNEESEVFVEEDVGLFMIFLFVVSVGHSKHFNAGTKIPSNKITI